MAAKNDSFWLWHVLRFHAQMIYNLTQPSCEVLFTVLGPSLLSSMLISSALLIWFINPSTAVNHSFCQLKKFAHFFYRIYLKASDSELHPFSPAIKLQLLFVELLLDILENWMKNSPSVVQIIPTKQGIYLFCNADIKWSEVE